LFDRGRPQQPEDRRQRLVGAGAGFPPEHVRRQQRRPTHCQAAAEDREMNDASDWTIERATAPTPEIVALLQALDADLSGPYSPDQHHALSVEKLFQPNVRFFVVRHAAEAVACGGLGFYDGYAELKRMYAKPEA